MITANPHWVLGIDLETTGLNPADDVDVITEVGAILWDIVDNKPIALLSETVELEPGRTLSPEIMSLTGITPGMVRAPIAKPEPVVLDELGKLAAMAGYYCAHNAPFDRGFLGVALERNFMSLPVRPWIDTSVDVPYPPRIRTRNLTHLAADHGFLNPLSHRAVFDVATMLKVLSLYSFDDVLLLNRSPSIKLIGTHGRDQNDDAKACGFRWDGERKEWFRIVKAATLPSLKITVPYREVAL